MSTLRQRIASNVAERGDRRRVDEVHAPPVDRARGARRRPRRVAVRRVHDSAALGALGMAARRARGRERPARARASARVADVAGDDLDASSSRARRAASRACSGSSPVAHAAHQTRARPRLGDDGAAGSCVDQHAERLAARGRSSLVDDQRVDERVELARRRRRRSGGSSSNRAASRSRARRARAVSLSAKSVAFVGAVVEARRAPRRAR